MNIVASTLALLCISLIGVVFAADCDRADTPCTRICSKNQCPQSMDCGESKDCIQLCVDRTCTGMICNAEKCTQSCTNCKSRMVCSSPNCDQTCEGNSCEMECTSRAKTCKQVCIANSTCTITCNAESCQNTCEGATCTGLPDKSNQVNKCDEVTKNCTQTCTGPCNKTLFCGGGNYEECHLSCENGCKMECDNTVKRCYQACVGDTPCTSVCNAASCHKIGKFGKSTGLPEKPKQVNKCDELTGKCTRTCTGECKGTTLSCGGGKFKECHLSCENGCKMECDNTVEKCYQTCIGDTPCTSVCDAASCYKVGKCDELNGKCTRTCTGECKGTTLSCGGGKFKECHLSCENGCKLKCDNTVEKCYQTCIGDTPCTSVCNVAGCYKVGKFHNSSAKVCRLNYIMIAFLACMMIFHVKNL